MLYLKSKEIKMPQYILKMSSEGRDFYLEWSTVVDAPVTYGMPLEEFKEYYRQEYGQEGFDDQVMQRLSQRLERVERTGCSAHGKDIDTILLGNRAGENETELTKSEIFRRYCLGIPSE